MSNKYERYKYAIHSTHHQTLKPRHVQQSKYGHPRKRGKFQKQRIKESMSNNQSRSKANQSVAAYTTHARSGIFNSIKFDGAQSFMKSTLH